MRRVRLELRRLLGRLAYRVVMAWPFDIFKLGRLVGWAYLYANWDYDRSNWKLERRPLPSSGAGEGGEA